MNDLMTKSFLNYVELKKQALKDLEAGPDLEMGTLSHPDEANLKQFFDEVGLIKGEVEGITDLLVDLRGLQEESKATHSPKILRGLRDRMNSDMVTILQKAKVVKTRIEALDHSNIANRALSSHYKEGSSIDRTRILVTNGLRSKVRDIMKEFQILRERIIADHKEGLRRRYFGATGQEASEEVIEKMFMGGGQVEVFENKAELNLELHERREAVKQFERSLTELHQLFLHMALLVETQGGQIDDIENNVAHAREYINSGTHNLIAAKELSKKGRKWACWLLIFARRISHSIVRDSDAVEIFPLSPSAMAMGD
ncbi:hypothetical protein ACLOJK_001796 [Asimina triloba]